MSPSEAKFMLEQLVRINDYLQAITYLAGAVVVFCAGAIVTEILTWILDRF